MLLKIEDMAPNGAQTFNETVTNVHEIIIIITIIIIIIIVIIIIKIITSENL